MNDDAVIAFAEGHRQPGEYLYCLVDPLGGCDSEDPLSVPSLSRTIGETAIARVMRPDLAHEPKDCPALIQLAAPGEPPLTRYLTLGARYAMDDVAYNKRYICGWLLSKQPLATVTQHLEAQCRALAPEHDRSVVPWFEPVRVELLAAAMGDRLGNVLWPIRAWLCPTSWGTFAIFHGAPADGPGTLPALAREIQQAAPVVTDFLGVWRHALEMPMAYAPWRWNGSTLLPPQAATHAFRLTRDAHHLGLHDSRDIIALNAHRVFIHPLLPQHAQVRAEIDQARHDEGTLQDRFETYDDTTWMRIANSLPQAANYS